MKRKLTILVVAVLGILSLAASLSRAAVVSIDTTASTAVASHGGTAQRVVTIGDQVVYAFYRDGNGSCAYRKSTNGGDSWGGPATVDAQTDCVRIAVWYEGWTPGHEGQNIHIATMDTSADDLWYNHLDTSSDTLLLGTAPVSITTSQGGTFTAGANYQAIAMATDGTVYVAADDGSDSFVVRCSSSCETGGNWGEAGTRPQDLANDFSYLAPLPGGDVLLVNQDISADDFRSKIFHASNPGACGTNCWDASWSVIDASASDNATYDAAFTMVVGQQGNYVFLGYAADISTLGTNDDVRTAVYDVEGANWSAGSDVLSNDARGVTGVGLARNENSGDIYVLYSIQETAGTATTANIYYKISDDNMASWGPELGPVNSSQDDIYGAGMNMVNRERVYATWVGATPDDLFGNTVADLVPPTYGQSAYRFFDNEDDTAVGTGLAAQNTTSTIPGVGNNFRLRLLLHVDGDDARANLNSFKLQVAEMSGSCAASSYEDVSESSPVTFYDNPSPGNGDQLTPAAGDPSHEGDTIVNQTYVEANPFTNSEAKILGRQDGKWDFSLRTASTTADTTYCFRVVEENGTELGSYGVYPAVYISAGGEISLELASGSEANFGPVLPAQVAGATSTVLVHATSTAGGYTLHVSRDSSTSTMSHEVQDLAMPDFAPWDASSFGGSGNATTSANLGEVLTFRVSSSTASFNSTWWGSGTPLYAGFPTSTEPVVSCASCTDGSTTSTVAYRLLVPEGQETGDYGGGITFTVLPNP